MRRRTFLAGTVAAVGGLAGCSSSGATVDSHPAASALDKQPTWEADSGQIDATIVAFEDPSCPSCRRFESSVFPKLMEQLVRPGHARFVFRNIPVVRSWAQFATVALETTYKRDSRAFRILKRAYFGRQSAITAGNVASFTKSVLDESTTLNGADVVESVRAGTERSAVEADVAAADEAGLQGTPTFYLFKDGSFKTKLTGAQRYSVFENSLGY